MDWFNAQRFKTERERDHAYWVERLQKVLERLGAQDHPVFSRIVTFIEHEQHAWRARWWVERLEPLVEEFEGDPFGTPETLRGDGYLASDRYERSHELSLQRHAGAFGSSGTGKTSFLLNALDMARALLVSLVLVLDRKDDFIHRAREGVPVVWWSELGLNNLCPPAPEIRIEEYLPDSMQMVAEWTGSMERGTALLYRAAQRAYERFHVYERWPDWDWERDAFPNLFDLRNELASKDFHRMTLGRGRDSAAALVDKLDSLFVQLGPVLRVDRGVNVARWYDERQTVIISLKGLSSQGVSFVFRSLLLDVFAVLRARDVRNRGVQALLLLDEARSCLI